MPFLWYPVCMRMFMSIPIKDEIIPYIKEIQETILSSSLKGSPSRLDQMHITLAFMKDVRKEQQSLLIEELKNIDLLSFNLEFNRLDFFNRPDGLLYYIEATKNKELIEIRQQVRKVLSTLHIPFDHKAGPFHITILRKVKLQHKGIKMVDLTLPRMKVNSFSLVESQLTKQDALHIEKGRFSLLGKTPALR